MSSIIRGTDNIDSAVIVETNGTAVTDNAIVRFDGVDGKVQSSSVIINDNGNLLLTSGTGGIGYGTGAGGTATQVTNKITPVTLDKPVGLVTMNNAALAAGASITFDVNNLLITNTDIVVIAPYYSAVNPASYKIEIVAVLIGVIRLKVTNITAGSLSEALQIKFAIIKGAVS